MDTTTTVQFQAEFSCVKEMSRKMFKQYPTQIVPPFQHRISHSKTNHFWIQTSIRSKCEWEQVCHQFYCICIVANCLFNMSLKSNYWNNWSLKHCVYCHRISSSTLSIFERIFTSGICIREMKQINLCSLGVYVNKSFRDFVVLAKCFDIVWHRLHDKPNKSFGIKAPVKAIRTHHLVFGFNTNWQHEHSKLIFISLLLNIGLG